MILDDKATGSHGFLSQTAAGYFERMIADPTMEVVVVLLNQAFQVPIDGRLISGLGT